MSNCNSCPSKNSCKSQATCNIKNNPNKNIKKITIFLFFYKFIIQTNQKSNILVLTQL